MWSKNPVFKEGMNKHLSEPKEEGENSWANTKKVQVMWQNEITRKTWDIKTEFSKEREILKRAQN